VLGQRGKLKKLDLSQVDQKLLIALTCLRLAVILCHSRNKPVLSGIENLQLNAEKMVLTVLEAWLETHPQTSYLLEEEVIAWRKVNWSLAITTKHKRQDAQTIDSLDTI
jgi:exopolyphosphatase/guanosine-5'-triphosphate,3'-diphosphate pyrophosphatase